MGIPETCNAGLNRDDALLTGARTAFIDRAHLFTEYFRPRFISNNYLLGRKVSAVITNREKSWLGKDY